VTFPELAGNAQEGARTELGTGRFFGRQALLYRNPAARKQGPVPFGYTGCRRIGRHFVENVLIACRWPSIAVALIDRFSVGQRWRQAANARPTPERQSADRLSTARRDSRSLCNCLAPRWLPAVPAAASTESADLLLLLLEFKSIFLEEEGDARRAARRRRSGEIGSRNAAQPGNRSRP